MSKEPYGDGLVFVVQNGLNTDIWLDGEWLGDVRLPNLDAFLRLRKLTDVDFICTLTEEEAIDVKESIEATSKSIKAAS